MIDIGTLVLQQVAIEDAFGDHHYEISGATWEGPPITIIGDDIVYRLPKLAVAAEGRIIQIGSYILQRTDLFNYDYLAYYWVKTDGGELYWWRWRAIRAVEHVWQRMVLTLAVWGLASWPQAGRRPSWGDVKRRWRK